MRLSILVKLGLFSTLVLLALTLTFPASANQRNKALVESKGQTVYVPAYTYVYLAEKGSKIELTTTLLIHNTDDRSPLDLISIKYFDGKGELVTDHLQTPKTLAPLEAMELLVRKPNRKSGSGACFLIRWQANKPVSPPIMECIMISAQGQQGISYRSTGQVIR